MLIPATPPMCFTTEGPTFNYYCRKTLAKPAPAQRYLGQLRGKIESNALNFWNGLEFHLGGFATCKSPFSPSRSGGDMRFFGAALVCIAVLYGLDAYLYDGQYFAILERGISDFYRHW